MSAHHSLLPQPQYIGRFAPSPTGPLHFGSLVAAVASYLDAHAHQGQWLVRMEDVDTPRCIPGAADSILRTLEAFGLHWHGPVLYQSARGVAYQAALDQLIAQGHAFPCACTRKEVGDAPYPGTCREGLRGKPARAYRLRVNSETIAFEDRLQGPYSANLETECGDFVLLRADGLWAYQLAVVVDDEAQGVTDVVRGADLLDSTPRQIHLQRCLGYRPLRYLHVPVALGEHGEKLSKQTLAPALDNYDAPRLLRQALRFLGQDAPALPLSELWAWARVHWRPDALPRERSRPLSG